ncbi:MAG: hypothetical protein RIR10_773 [Planctomycetota bacterium]
MNDTAPNAPRATPPIYPEQVVVPPAAPTPTNRLGVIAFVFSILGVTCLPVIGGLVGLICGIIAVRREPRGFSIAAITISALGGCLLMPLILLPALLLPALAKARTTARQVMNQSAATQVQTVIEDFQATNGRFPNDLQECFGGGSIPFDAHGTELRMKVVVTSDESKDHTMTVSTTESKIQIWSAGEDQTWDTEDDELLIDGESSTKTTKTESTTTSSSEAGENR